MIDKAYIVTDLGPGDGGKGGVVHKIANAMKASAVLKFGAGQGSHGVVTDLGEKFNFSHWGCGTLEAIPTFITERFVVIPHGILKEGDDLRRMGINDPYQLLTISPNCLCATPFHRLASQLNELARKDCPRGTIGTGAGEAYRLYTRHRNCKTIVQPVRMFDVMTGGEELVAKLRNIQQYYQRVFNPKKCLEFLPEDQPLADELLGQLFDDGLLDWTVEKYAELAQTSLRLALMPEYLCELKGCIVAECSHGVLTDSELGFKPHTSAIRTVPELVIRDLRDAGFAGELVRLGVTRAYAIRHGAGPLPTADDTTLETLLPGSHKADNRWQGKVRVGALDFVLLKYAIDCCGGVGAFDGLCVTWADQIWRNQQWQYCTEYAEHDGKFTANSLKKVVPQITVRDISHLTVSGLGKEICQTFLAQLDIPVRMISFGPDDQSKNLY